MAGRCCSAASGSAPRCRLSAHVAGGVQQAAECLVVRSGQVGPVISVILGLYGTSKRQPGRPPLSGWRVAGGAAPPQGREPPLLYADAAEKGQRGRAAV